MKREISLNRLKPEQIMMLFSGKLFILAFNLAIVSFICSSPMHSQINEQS
jgi:hypothetical protein